MSKKKTGKGATVNTKTTENKKDAEPDKISDTDSAEESAKKSPPMPTPSEEDTIFPSISEETREMVSMFDTLLGFWTISVMSRPIRQLISSSFKTFRRTGHPETKRLLEALEQIQASKSEIEQFRNDLLERIKK